MKINKRDCNLISECLKMISDQAVQARTSCFFTEAGRCKGYCVSWLLFYFFSHSQRQKLDLCSFLGLIDFFFFPQFFFFFCLRKSKKTRNWLAAPDHFSLSAENVEATMLGMSWTPLLGQRKGTAFYRVKKNFNDETCAFFFFYVAPCVY